jgi:hypothetical protein
LAEQLETFHEIVNQWKEIFPQVQAAAANQDPEVRAFLTAAAGHDGAPWTMVTDKVMAWLADDENSDAIRVVLS